MVRQEKHFPDEDGKGLLMKHVWPYDHVEMPSEYIKIAFAFTLNKLGNIILEFYLPGPGKEMKLKDFRRLPLDPDQLENEPNEDHPGSFLPRSWDRLGAPKKRKTRVEILARLLPTQAFLRLQMPSDEKSYSLEESAPLLDKICELAQLTYTKPFSIPKSE